VPLHVMSGWSGAKAYAPSVRRFQARSSARPGPDVVRIADIAEASRNGARLFPHPREMPRIIAGVRLRVPRHTRAARFDPIVPLPLLQYVASVADMRPAEPDIRPIAAAA
jgi:hypothetical protein